jgi:hypothetical protein
MHAVSFLLVVSTDKGNFGFPFGSFKNSHYVRAAVQSSR